MSDLSSFLEQCGSAGVVVRYPGFALTTLAQADIQESDKILKVFEQGASIGTQVYIDQASFSYTAFRKLLERFGITETLAERLLASLKQEPPAQLHKQESF